MNQDLHDILNERPCSDLDKHLHWTEYVNMITAKANSIRDFYNLTYRNVPLMLKSPPIPLMLPHIGLCTCHI